ncbi:MAG: alanine--glyoxylate aminotransferase family protein [Limnochordaceae bacterium]|nr:alanine--glyoxylate aminotransferase family protein [Limnochordaceae bacterium]
MEIATAFGAQVEVMEYPWHTGVDPQQLGERLRETPGVRAIFATHNESSTGVLNDLQAIARVRDQVAPDALVVVDSVSGLGGAPLSMDAWGLDAVVSASQKCIMAPPGLAFVALSRRAWQRAETSRASRYYLDLAAHRRMFEKGQTPWTPAVSVVYAVDEALDLMAREAPEERFARHRLMRDMVRAGLRGGRMGAHGRGSLRLSHGDRRAPAGRRRRGGGAAGGAPGAGRRVQRWAGAPCGPDPAGGAHGVRHAARHDQRGGGGRNGAGAHRGAGERSG